MSGIVEHPLFSIVMPTLDMEKYIQETLCSIAEQTHKNFELIIIDGGSTDRTVGIIKEWQDRINIRLCIISDSGAWEAINFGFSLAKGHYFLWMNGDDLFFNRNSLKRIVQNCFKHSDVVIFSTQVLDEVRNEKFTMIPRSPNPASIWGGNIFTGSMVFSKRIWQGFGGFSGNYQVAYEYEFLSYLVASKAKVDCMTDVIAVFRIHSGALSQRSLSTLVAEKQKLAELSPKPGVLDLFLNACSWLRYIVIRARTYALKNRRLD